MTLFVRHEFRENLRNASHASLNRINEMLPVFYQFYPIWTKFGTERLHAVALITYEFRRRRKATACVTA
jgi:hypothetical protein